MSRTQHNWAARDFSVYLAKKFVSNVAIPSRSYFLFNDQIGNIGKPIHIKRSIQT